MLGGWSKEAGFSAKYGKPMAVFFRKFGARVAIPASMMLSSGLAENPDPPFWPAILSGYRGKPD